MNLDYRKLQAVFKIKKLSVVWLFLALRRIENLIRK